MGYVDLHFTTPDTVTNIFWPKLLVPCFLNAGVYCHIRLTAQNKKRLSETSSRTFRGLGIVFHGWTSSLGHLTRKGPFKRTFCWNKLTCTKNHVWFRTSNINYTYINASYVANCQRLTLLKGHNFQEQKVPWFLSIKACNLGFNVCTLWTYSPPLQIFRSWIICPCLARFRFQYYFLGASPNS